MQRRLAEVGITGEDVPHRMPFQLSGGMCQRVALAAALARDPELLIADEPSTALDVTTQAEIMKLLKRVQGERGMSLILITHDLRLAFSTCDRVYVLYAGSLLEVGDAAERRDASRSIPTRSGLLLSEPPAEKRVPRLVAIRGSVPRPDDVAGRCAFADRCDWATEICRAGKAAALPRSRRDASRPASAGARSRARCARCGGAPSQPASRAGHAAPERPLVRVDAAWSRLSSAAAGRPIHALKGVSIEIAPGESVGLVGESGSGKTTLGRCLVGLETPTAGDDRDRRHRRQPTTARSRRRQRSQLRRTIQMVFQDPYSTLNPRHSVAPQPGRGAARQPAVRAATPDARIRALACAMSGCPRTMPTRRPASLSGGERQRVAIARSLAVGPKMLVCDEPVSALDVSVQAQILNLFKRLQHEHGLSYLFITHDLAVVRQVADRIYVLYLGEIVEQGPTEEVMSQPAAPLYAPPDRLDPEIRRADRGRDNVSRADLNGRYERWARVPCRGSQERKRTDQISAPATSRILSGSRLTETSRIGQE